MQATRNLFLRTSSADLDAIEAALLRADAAQGLDEACRRLVAIAEGGKAQAYPRIASIAAAAKRLLENGAGTRALALRALMRLKDVLRGATVESEPQGDDSDLLAAAEAERLPSLSDALAQAHAKLQEIAPDTRDPRLTALMQRLANLNAGFDETSPQADEAEADEAETKQPGAKTPIVLRRAK